MFKSQIKMKMHIHRYYRCTQLSPVDFENQKNDIPDLRNYFSLFIIALLWFSARHIPQSKVVGWPLPGQPPHSRLAAMVTVAHVPVRMVARDDDGRMANCLLLSTKSRSPSFIPAKSARHRKKALSSLRKARSVTRAKRSRWFMAQKHQYILRIRPSCSYFYCDFQQNVTCLRRSCDRKSSETFLYASTYHYIRDMW